LRKLHRACREYQALNPEDYETYDFEYQPHLDRIKLPKNPDNFGLIHADFWANNQHLFKNKEDKYEVVAFDWEDVRRGWFMMDLGVWLFTTFHNMQQKKENVFKDDDEFLLLSQRNVCKWFVDA